MGRFICWTLVLLLFAGLLGVAARALRARAEAGKGMPDYSVYSEADNGLAETARFVRRLGWEPVAVTRPVPLRGSGEPALLVLAEPEDGELPETEVKALLRWVGQGNTLLLAGTKATTLHDALDVGVSADERAAGATHPVDLGGAGGYTDEIDRLVAEGLVTLEADGGLPLWWLRDRPGALVVRHGRGRVLVLGDPALLTPRGLRRADNAVLLYRVLALHARDGHVYFDEYHHGLRSAGGFWEYLRHHGQLGLVPAAAVVFAVGVWSAAVRLGPAVPRPRPPRADAVDFASAVARIYQGAGVRRPPARTLVRGFLAALTRHLRLRRNALPAEILAAWRQRHPDGSAQRLQALLRGVADLRKGEVADAALLARARAFDQFLREHVGPS